MKVNFKDLILFENEDYIVINKPPHVATINERTADKSVSILRMAKEYSFDAQVAHRLDKETSGVLAIAKNPEAYRHLAMQFEHREVTKRYHAVANGVHDFDSISVFLPIAPLKDGTAVKIDRQKGKAAETIFFTLKAFKKHTLVECLPITGRMHQIRVHLQCLKAPIVCDPTYGGKDIYLSELKKDYKLKQETDELPIMHRVALHAYSLTFKLMNGDPITVEAPYPKDFGVLVKLLEKNN
ncbi:RNA pseudouridine synthase [Runella sp.]|uniref:RluA family pseudouridine synthase n=1 Tax=Runella sp. TaxID=1960881 RepID=UPI00262921C2|nr:RNA pseudouridine synthase [Runella sp.]